MRIDLIRHGATPGNEQRRYVGGQTDGPLSKEGLDKLRAMSKDESVERIYTSPLERTIETARILFPKAGAIPVRGLREMEFGAFEGKTADELADDAAYRAWVDGGCAGACPGGESRAQFAKRCVQAFLERVRTEERYGAPRVVFVVHGGTIMAILSELAQPKIGYFEAQVKPAQRWVCTWDGEHLVDARREGDK